MALPSGLQSIVNANTGLYEAALMKSSIQIIQLHPGLDDEPISCSFTTVDLAQAEPFEALSYCWGTVAAENPISCNGKAFWPTENLYTALRGLRQTSKVRDVWVDAICINQASILERDRQVPLMRQIYTKATQVTVFLGREDDSSALALATMRNIFGSCCSKRYGSASVDEWLMKLENDEQYWQALREEIVQEISPPWPDDPKNCARSLQTFFQRPWFSRVWVIQEVQGCPNITVQVGATTVAWSIIASAATWVVYGPSPVTQINEPYKFGGFLHTDFMRQRPFISMDDLPFLDLLDRCRAFKCTIDKDRIFALLQHQVARLLPAKSENASAIKIIYPLRNDQH